MNKPIVLITSCWGDEQKLCNELIRRTWTQNRALPYRIVMGGEKRPPLEDEMLVNSPDDYKNLSYKRRESIRQALSDGYTHLFCAYRDTYINVGRLLNSDYSRADYIGHVCRASWPKGWLSYAFCDGGAGFWLSAEAARIVASAPIESDAEHSGASQYDDGWIGRTLTKAGILPIDDRRYSMGTSYGDNKEEPVLRGNDKITCHLSKETGNYNPQWMWTAYMEDLDR